MHTRLMGKLCLAITLAAVPLVVGCRGNKVGTAACTPGEPVFVSCGCLGVGSCSEQPDPVLRVCDGSLSQEECTWDVQLGENDDGPMCGRCPGLTVTCPDSGDLLVIARGFYPNEIVDCDWALNEGGPPPPPEE